MNDLEKEFISVKDAYGNHKYTVSVARLYAEFKEELIEEGFIEANPKKWVRPKREDVNDYFVVKLIPKSLADMHSAHGQSDQFYEYWDGLDWKVRNTRIKSWKGRAATWIKNNEKFKRNDSQRFNGLSAADQIAASIANRDR